MYQGELRKLWYWFNGPMVQWLNGAMVQWCNKLKKG